MLRCRKNQSTLSVLEKTKFVNAVLAIKANGTYDQFVEWHLDNMPHAHRGSAFLPWHRVFINKFEEALRAVDTSVTLPYWDWTVDQSPTGSPWTIDFMGGNGRPVDGRVMDGPFAFDTGNFTLVFDGPDLRRRFAVSPSAPTLPTPGDLAACLLETPYDVAPWNRFSASGFRNRLEGWISGPQLHNRVHVWIGGSMAPASSPNDPIFFLNHCFVDKIWADWQAAHPGLFYLPASGAATGHNLNDSMEPWAGLGEIVRPIDTLDHHAMGYAYDTEGVCAPKFKLLDDTPKLKVLDDGLTLKFADERTTIKALDDGATLKVIDDGPTIKFADDGTLKNFDDVKTPGLDKLPIAERIGANKPVLDSAAGGITSTPPAAPFLLSTPHHSMAWTGTFPASLEATLRQYESEIRQYEAAIERLTQAQRGGAQSATNAQQLQALTQAYQALVTEYRQLAQQGVA